MAKAHLSTKPEGKSAHVNMMTDTIIANLPPHSLRSVLRSLLSSYPDFTAAFENETRQYLQSTTPKSQDIGGQLKDESGIFKPENVRHIQARIRCMLGCGLCFQSLQVLCGLVDQAKNMNAAQQAEANDVESLLCSIDGDIVQAATAVQKTLVALSGSRDLSADEKELVEGLHFSLKNCEIEWHHAQGQEYPFARGLMAIADLLGYDVSNPDISNGSLTNGNTKQSLIENNGELISAPPPTPKETFFMKNRELPRIFSGLWQLSSPAWGAAPASKIINQFTKHVQNGFTAFDMADHYGDAEIIFGRFRSSYPHSDSILAATKYCVFHPMTVSREAVRANVTERCQRLQTEKVDLLQFHWQFYEDPSYIDALKYLQEDERVDILGLCNFDTEHMLRVIDAGVAIYSNQIQFSLIDTRPIVKMGQVCEKHDIKLLTYGTLCGGFLSEKWLNEPEPDLYGEKITPSQRKYYTMILTWGTWSLFQTLLSTLHQIAQKHHVSVSNVATRWVLDFPYVGAVIVGARMGVSEHIDDNLASFGWKLDDQDREAIEQVLKKSKRAEMFEGMGDCGGEYR